MREVGQYYVYIISNWTNTAIYVGITKDLRYRVLEHKEKRQRGFTAQYNIKKLVYYEEFESAYEAIQREKQIKNWKRKWKEELIEKNNLHYADLSKNWFDDPDSGSSPE